VVFGFELVCALASVYLKSWAMQLSQSQHAASLEVPAGAEVSPKGKLLTRHSGDKRITSSALMSLSVANAEISVCALVRIKGSFEERPWLYLGDSRLDPGLRSTPCFGGSGGREK
jgi:hypothetical protein